jgi:hypothetical protein
VKIPEGVEPGKLFAGDSYILLSTVQKGSSLQWNLHFWLGSETSQDESGVAAYKTVELDDYLGGGPIQYRECMEHESDLFMSYFKTQGLEYIPGGVDSGFNKVGGYYGCVCVWVRRLVSIFEKMESSTGTLFLCCS